MLKESGKPQNWYSEYIATYTYERKDWYEIADAYHQTRPRYPQQLLNRVVELAELPSRPNAPSRFVKNKPKSRPNLLVNLYEYIYRQRSPDEISKHFSTLTLDQVYATILY